MEGLEQLLLKQLMDRVTLQGLEIISLRKYDQTHKSIERICLLDRIHECGVLLPLLEN